MSDADGDVWRAIRKDRERNRKRFMAEALANDDGGWIKHTEWHWSRSIDGERLDYWPSRKKFQWHGKVNREIDLMNRLIKGEMK